MYAIASKFPDQKKFQTIDIHNGGQQVNNWLYCTLFKTKERANEILDQIKLIAIPGVEFKVIKYYSKGV